MRISEMWFHTLTSTEFCFKMEGILGAFVRYSEDKSNSRV